MRRNLLFMAALAALALVGCGSSEPTGPSYPTGKIIVTSPNEGDIFTIGSPVTISWRCEGCEDLRAQYVTVYLNVGKSREVIDKHFLSGSLTWPAGKVAGGLVTYGPGLYHIDIGSEIIWENEQLGHTEAWGASGTFKLVSR